METVQVSPAFLAFSGFAALWESIRPDTPFGKYLKQQQTPSGDDNHLKARWDATDLLMGFLQEGQRDVGRLDKITHHLKRLPRFTETPQPAFDEIELFQFKKFIYNYKALLKLLSPEIIAHFQFTYHAQALEAQLGQGVQEAESFYITDEYLPELAACRQSIRQVDKGIAAYRQKRLTDIATHCGLVFEGKPFLIIPRDRLPAPGMPTGWLLMEPFDDDHWRVSPLPCQEMLQLDTQRVQWAHRERHLEQCVLEGLSHEVRAVLPHLLQCKEAVAHFDLALACARWALTHRLTRPFIGEGPLTVEGGRWLPCEERCLAHGVPYTSLDVCFAKDVNLIFGSNMGGKTVMLKTLALLQLCTQYGLFVPARRFSTRLFHAMHFLGETAFPQGESSGLSGFGLEIQQFNLAAANLEQPTLLLFDEFARTTNAQEAECLLAAIAQHLAVHPGVVALFSTHFHTLQRSPSVGYWRMKGLDRDRLAATLPYPGPDGGKCAEPLSRSLALINQAMDYRLVDDDPGLAITDALAVARLLGMDTHIVNQAQHILEHP